MATLEQLGKDIHAKHEAKLAARKAAWEEVKRAAPDQAAWLEALSKTFGKPRVAMVKVDGKVILDSRRFK